MNRDEIDRFLQQTLVARLTSIRPDGYPHTTPLWYV
jgi:nitroimidazol reductase NimA-like FMN-containing flavoprotein (pyridoxamine 5'-phosphate oxidase superfamily)